MTRKWDVVALITWSFFMLASGVSSMTGAYNQTESWDEPTRYFMVLLAAACVVGSAILIDRMRRDKIRGGFWSAFLGVVGMIAFLSFVASSFVLDFIQISTVWQTGEADKTTVERVVARDDTALDALKAKADAARLAAENAPDISALNAAVANLQGQIARQSEEVRLESLRGHCGPRCEEKQQILAGIETQLNEAVRTRDAAAAERDTLIAANTAAQAALADVATAQAEDPTAPSRRAIARTAMVSALADAYAGFDRDVAVAFLLALAMNLGAATMYTWTYTEEEVIEANDIPIYSERHMSQMRDLMGQLATMQFAVAAGAPAQMTVTTATSPAPHPAAAPEATPAEPLRATPSELRAKQDDKISDETLAEWDDFVDEDDHVAEVEFDNVRTLPPAPRRGTAA